MRKHLSVRLIIANAVAGGALVGLIVMGAMQAHCQAQPPAFAPGAVNPAVTQKNLAQTVCLVGWTKTQRPSRYWSSAHKAELLHRAHLPLSAASLFQLDHVIALEVGGHPTAAANLWLQPREHPGADEKDHLENLVHWKLCHGQMTLREAQDVFRGDWWAAYKRLVGHLP